MSSIVPYLTFRNGDDSVSFLTDVLGFEVVTKQMADDGSVVHCELKRDDAVLMGGSGEVAVGAAPGVYLVVDEVAELFALAVQRGASVVFAPEQTEWGTWRARFCDPDGHEWTIGTYQPGQSW